MAIDAGVEKRYQWACQEVHFENQKDRRENEKGAQKAYQKVHQYVSSIRVASVHPVVKLSES